MPMTQAYPTGTDIEGQQQQAQSMAGKQNPVMDALKVLQLYVTAQKQQGNEAPGQAFLQLLQSLSGGGQEMPQEGAPEEQGPAFNPFEAPEEQAAGMRPEQQMRPGMRPQQMGRRMGQVMS